jgi:hypothetical protein
MNKPIASIIIGWSLNCASYFTNFCRQSRQGCGMQSSLHHNSVISHNLVPLKRQKKSHPVPVYSLPVGPQSPIMPLHAVASNKADTVGLVCFWSCFFFRHQVCSSTMRMRAHAQRPNQDDKLIFWNYASQERKYKSISCHCISFQFSLAIFRWWGARIL